MISVPSGVFIVIQTRLLKNITLWNEKKSGRLAAIQDYNFFHCGEDTGFCHDN